MHSILQVVDAFYASLQIRCTAHNLRLAGFTKYKITYQKGPTFSFTVYRTKERYYMAMKRFCHFLAGNYHLQKLSNISGKHLVAYVLWMQEKGLSASTIKTELAAIRFFHDKISNPKYILPTNAELGVELERRRFGNTDRTWSVAEFNRMLGKALDRPDYILALYLAHYAGFRIHECIRNCPASHS